MAERVRSPLTHTDIALMRTRLALSPGQRLQAMLDARALLVGLLRGRLRQRHPELPERELNLKLLEEIEGARDGGTRPESLPGYPA